MEGSHVVAIILMLKFAAIQMDAPVYVRESSEEKPLCNGVKLLFFKEKEGKGS